MLILYLYLWSKKFPLSVSVVLFRLLWDGASAWNDQRNDNLYHITHKNVLGFQGANAKRSGTDRDRDRDRDWDCVVLVFFTKANDVWSI